MPKAGVTGVSGPIGLRGVDRGRGGIYIGFRGGVRTSEGR